MGKKKGKQVDDYWSTEFEQDAQLTGATTTVEPETTEDAAIDHDPDQSGLMAVMNAAQKKKQAKKKKNNSNNNNDEEENNDTQNDANDGEVRIKSKKEKEKERKERLKQKKKLEQNNNSAPSNDAASKSTQNDANRANESKEEAKKDISIDTKPSTASAASKASKKKVNPNVAALREMLAAKKAAEEEQRRLEEEQQRLEEERLRKIEEEERQKAEERRIKKEKEKERKEQLRKEGKLLSKAEKERQRLNQLKLEQLLAQGVTVPALNDQDKKKKRVVYDNRKKKNSKQQQDEPEKAEVKEEKVKEEPVQEVAQEENEDVAESWEEIADSWEDAADAMEGEENDQNDENEDEDEESSSEEEDSSDESEEEMTAEEKKKEEARQRRLERHEQALAARSKDNLRSPICVILGHVDTGKTKLLDKIRQTNVQEGEAGGITQQIGATYFPTDAIQQKTDRLRKNTTFFNKNFEFKTPGLLVIDTPGHESFTNLRSRGSSLCNIAILVVDIMHGLEQQTIESIGLLKQRKTPFIVALNKIDRIYGWQADKDAPFQETFAKQNEHVHREFETRLQATITAFAEQGLNAALYFENPDVRKYVSFVPTSAVTGEGVPDLLMLLMQLTQERMTESLMYLSELEATVLEVKVIEGHGTTIDVVLSNGVIHEGDRIVVCGLNGPIVTNIRALLTPQPMRELRVKSAYVHHKEIKAAMGVKISAPGLEHAIAGSRLLVVTPEDDEEELQDEVMADLTDLFASIDKTGQGVCVQASTLGSLEALLSFLKDSKIPVAGINIGPVHKKDVIRASVMLEHAPEFATILAFDVKVDKDAEDMATELGVRIFKAEIIYHLFDQFTAYFKDLQEQKKKEMAPQAIWPCWLRIVPGCVFNKKDPIILGMEVVEGTLRIGTPLCVPSRGGICIGKVVGIELNHKTQDTAKKGQQVAVRIEATSEGSRVFGRHFEEKDEIVSKISRQSIDVLKESFRSEVSREEWLLVKKLKTVLLID